MFVRADQRATGEARSFRGITMTSNPGLLQIAQANYFFRCLKDTAGEQGGHKFIDTQLFLPLSNIPLRTRAKCTNLCPPPPQFSYLAFYFGHLPQPLFYLNGVPLLPQGKSAKTGDPLIKEIKDFLSLLH